MFPVSVYHVKFSSPLPSYRQSEVKSEVERSATHTGDWQLGRLGRDAVNSVANMWQ